MAKQCGAHLTGYDHSCKACREADAAHEQQLELEREHQKNLEEVRRGKARADDFSYRQSSSSGCLQHMLSYDPSCGACRAVRREAADKDRNSGWYRELDEAEAARKGGGASGRGGVAATAAAAAGTGSFLGGAGVFGTLVVVGVVLFVAILVFSFAVAVVTYAVVFGAVVVVPGALGVAAWLSWSPQRRVAQQEWVGRLTGVGVGWAVAAAGMLWAVRALDENILLFLGVVAGSLAGGYLLFRGVGPLAQRWAAGTGDVDTTAIA